MFELMFKMSAMREIPYFKYSVVWACVEKYRNQDKFNFRFKYAMLVTDTKFIFLEKMTNEVYLYYSTVPE